MSKHSVRLHLGNMAVMKCVYVPEFMSLVHRAAV